MRNDSLKWCILKSRSSVLSSENKIYWNIFAFGLKDSSWNLPFRFSNIISLMSGSSWLVITGRFGSLTGICPAMTIMWPSLIMSGILIILRRLSNESLFPKFFVIINVDIIAWCVSSWLSSFQQSSATKQNLLCNLFVSARRYNSKTPVEDFPSLTFPARQNLSELNWTIGDGSRAGQGKRWTH